MRDFSQKYRYDVIAVGETTVDAFMTLPEGDKSLHSHDEDHDVCFRPGEKIRVEKYNLCVGGNATNVAVGLNRLGIHVGLCTEIGDDEMSFKIRNTLAKENIERLLIKQTAGTQTNFSVVINYLGDRTIFVKNIEREHDFDLDNVTASFVYLTSLGRTWEAPYKKVLAFIEENDSTLAFNPGIRQIREGKDLVHDVLKKTAMLFVNKEEAETLLYDMETDKTDKEYVHELAKKLQELGSKTVVITDGKRGSYALSEHGEFYHRPSDTGPVVERTGAGDAYTTGFIAASISGLSIPEAMEWGAADATAVVAQIGAQTGLLTKEQIEAASNSSASSDQAAVKKEELMGVKKSDEFEIMPAPLE